MAKVSKKEIRSQVAATLFTTFDGLKEGVGSKKFKRNVKKASKVLVAGLKKTSTKKAPRKTKKETSPEEKSRAEKEIGGEEEASVEEEASGKEKDRGEAQTGSREESCAQEKEVKGQVAPGATPEEMRISRGRRPG